MGDVYSATDLATHGEVAIKVVSRMLVDDQVMARLHREAEAAARIRSDYVPRVVEVAGTDERELFLVMERLHGESLSQTIRTRGALPWSEVQHIAEDVLRGLIDAHTAGIVHRDLKPSNVFLSEKNGRVRAFVLDFGVCKMDGLDHERLTGTGESIGTVAYMAPEQIRGAAKVDDRADLYAFGALVFEMLTGRLPHEGPSQMAILASKLEKPAARLAEHVLVEVPQALDALVAKTLARDPQDRFASAQELLKAWRAVSTGPLTPAIPFAPVVAEELAARRSEHDAPTRIVGQGAQGPTMVVSPASVPPMPVSRPPSAPVPFEPFATQTALTSPGTQLGSSRRTARVAVVLAACVMVVGLVVIGISVARGPSSGSPATSATEPSASAVAAEPAPPPPVPIDTSIVVDLGPDPVVAGDAGTAAPTPPRDARKPVHRVRQPARGNPRNAPAPTSTQHITTQPRY